MIKMNIVITFVITFCYLIDVFGYFNIIKILIYNILHKKNVKYIERYSPRINKKSEVYF